FERDIHAFRRVAQAQVLPGGRLIVESFEGIVGSRWNLRVGASVELGPSVTRAEVPSMLHRWSVGSQLGYTTTSTAASGGTVGIFASYGLAKYLDLDFGLSTYLSATLPSAQYEGGRMSQALAGVKIGVREGRFGVFFKAR